MLVLIPARTVVVVRQPHRVGLLLPHEEGLVVLARDFLTRAQFSDDGFYVLHTAAHPFQRCVLETLLYQRRADGVVTEDRSVVPFSGLVQLDSELDRRGFGLLSNARLYFARGLPNLQLPLVRVVGNRISVNAWARHRLRRKYVVNGLTHHHSHRQHRRTTHRRARPLALQ